MRDKEAIDVERKNLSRNVEKQAKVLERLYDSERNLQNQIVSPFMRIIASPGYNCNFQADQDKELTNLKKAYDLLKLENHKLMLETNDAKLQVEQEKKEKEAVSCSIALVTFCQNPHDRCELQSTSARVI
jgi:hypothetical protein